MGKKKFNKEWNPKYIPLLKKVDTKDRRTAKLH